MTMKATLKSTYKNQISPKETDRKEIIAIVIFIFAPLPLIYYLGHA